MTPAQPHTACPDDTRLDEIEGEQIVAAVNRGPDWREEIRRQDAIWNALTGGFRDA